MKKCIGIALFFSGLISINLSHAEGLAIYRNAAGDTIFGRSSDKPLPGYNKISETIYSDPLNQWNISCKKDHFNGVKHCDISKKSIAVFYINNKYSVVVGRQQFPRSTSAIKVDENTTIYGYEGGSKSPEIVIKQMKSGKLLHTRYQEWPYQYNKDEDIDLTDFKERFDEMMELYKKL